MSLRAFQTALVNVYQSEKYRGELFSGAIPVETLGLTPREQQALFGIDRDMLEWFCLELLHKSSSAFRKAFERTGETLGPDFVILCRQFHAVHGPLLLQNDTILAFRPHLFGRLREKRVPITVWETARFEYTRVILRMYTSLSETPALLEAADVVPLHDRSFVLHEGQPLSFRIAFTQSYACDVLAFSRGDSAERELQPQTVLFYQTEAGAPIRIVALENQ